MSAVGTCVVAWKSENTKATIGAIEYLIHEMGHLQYNLCNVLT